MSTTTFKISYRPAKIGFLINENSIEDLIKAAGINSMLWGGIYNPIIPVSNEKENTKEIAENFNIDILYDLSKSEITSNFINDFPYLKPSIGGMKEIFLDYSKQFAYIDAGNLLVDSVIIQKAKAKNPVYLKFSDDHKYSDLLKVLFGYYPEIENSDFDFLKEYIDNLNPGIREVTHTSTSVGIFHNSLTPIDFTGIDIGEYGSIKKHFNLRHSNNSIYIGNANNFDDLVYYWNLRAYGYSLNYFSIDDAQFFEENIVDFIKTFDKPEAEMTHGPESSILFRKTNEKYFETIRQKMQSNPYFCPLHDTYLGLLAYDKPFGYFKDGSNSALVHINDDQSDKYQVSFSLPNVPFTKYENRDTSKQQFLVSITPDSEPFYKHTLNVPFVQDLHEFYSRKIVGKFSPFDLRCEPNGIGILINNETRALKIYPIPFNEIIWELFKEAGLEPQQSQPGLLTTKIINKLGHLDSCRVFKIKGVRKIFRSLKVEDTVTRSRIEQVIFDNGTFKKYHKLFIEKRNFKDLNGRNVTDFLFRHDFFRAGLELNCNSCHLENWIPVKRLDDFWICEFCGNNNQLNVALKDRGDWKFRKSGLFGKNNNQEGAIPVILTLLQLYRCLQNISTKHTMLYETATKFIKPKDCEIDFSVVNLKHQDDFEVGFGECKDEGGIIDSNDIDNLKSVYEKLKEKFYKPFIIISKAADRFSDAEINLFKKTKSEGYRLILFTNRELEPYEIYEDYICKTQLPRNYPFSLIDLHWNSDFIYLSDTDSKDEKGTLY